MADISEPSTNGQRLPTELADVLSSGSLDTIEVSTQDFKDQFDEDILQTLDVDGWRLGSDLNEEYDRIEREVREAETLETAEEKKIREVFFPRLEALANMPRNTGLHVADAEDIAAVHRGLLFNGAVEACDGIVRVHDTLPLTIYQFGVSLVTYQGEQGSRGERLFRRDLRQKGVDVDEWIDFLERRSKRDSSTRMPGSDHLGELVQKTMLQYAERAVLLRHSKARWRMGHGNPVTYELLTGGGNQDVMVQATHVLRELVEKYQRFVFIASEPRDRFFLTVGQALRPMEYAILGTLDDQISGWLHQARFKVGDKLPWDNEWIRPHEWIPRFITQVAPKIVVGLFRASLLAPAQLFYAHVDQSEIAAHIALADSMLQEGQWWLLAMARRACAAAFGETLESLTESAYAAAGAQHRLFGRARRPQ